MKFSYKISTPPPPLHLQPRTNPLLARSELKNNLSRFQQNLKHLEVFRRKPEGYTICDRRSWIYDRRFAIYDRRLTKLDIRIAICEGGFTIDNLRSWIYGLQYAKEDLQSTLYNIHYTIYIIQITIHDFNLAAAFAKPRYFNLAPNPKITRAA